MPIENAYVGLVIPEQRYDKFTHKVRRYNDQLVFERGNETLAVDLTKPSTLLYALTGYIHPSYQDFVDEVRFELEKIEGVSEKLDREIGE